MRGDIPLLFGAPLLVFIGGGFLILVVVLPIMLRAMDISGRSTFMLLILSGGYLGYMLLKVAINNGIIS